MGLKVNLYILPFLKDIMYIFICLTLQVIEASVFAIWICVVFNTFLILGVDFYF